MSYLFTFLIHDIKDPDAASQKARDFFETQGVLADNGHFKGSGWEGRYRFLPDPPNWNLEITLTDKPFWALESIIVGKAKAFFAESL